LKVRTTRDGPDVTRSATLPFVASIADVAAASGTTNAEWRLAGSSVAHGTFDVAA
jgi:hypothetical protein